MSPEIVVLDTRGVTDKAGFLAAAARDLQFPDYFGNNWDAFEECVRDFGTDRGSTLVVWTGAAALPQDVRDMATDIFDTGLGDRVDVLVVDGIDDGLAQPDFAVSVDRVTVPQDGLPAAQDFFRTVGFLVHDRRCEADAISVELVPVPDFHPGIGPQIAVADLAGLVERLTAAGYEITQNSRSIDVSDPHGTLITFVDY